jgi:hypothetical protein
MFSDRFDRIPTAEFHVDSFRVGEILIDAAAHRRKDLVHDQDPIASTDVHVPERDIKAVGRTRGEGDLVRFGVDQTGHNVPGMVQASEIFGEFVIRPLRIYLQVGFQGAAGGQR